jgi:sugar lactone lactonase YvrE
MKRKSRFILLIFGLLVFGQTNRAQQLPPIFADTPKQIVAARTIAEFPVNTFLENVAVDKKGVLFVNSYEDGKVYRVTTAGAKSEFAQIPGKVAGIAFDKSGSLIISGVTNEKKAAVFRVDKRGKVETLATIDDAIFLNGVTQLSGDKFLIADSYKGAIWEFNAKTRKYAVWLTDESLARSNVDNPTPAVNGLKIYKNNLYATNTQNQKIFRIPILAGEKAGKPELFVEKINGDDFAFDDDGNLFVTTHVYNSVVRVEPDGKMTVIATENESVTGDTALVFGRGQDKNAIFVVTNGGMSLPPAGGVQTAKIVRLEVKASGAKR